MREACARLAPHGGQALPPVHRRSEFNLARSFHRVLPTALIEVTRPEGLTPVEPAVFASLHDAPGIGERRLAERIGIDLTSVQRMVKHLVLRGLVCRVPAPKAAMPFFASPQRGTISFSGCTLPLWPRGAVWCCASRSASERPCRTSSPA
jgi:hypothetical protein